MICCFTGLSVQDFFLFRTNVGKMKSDDVKRDLRSLYYRKEEYWMDRIGFSKKEELTEEEKRAALRDALNNAYLALKEKGYSAIDQLTGFVLKDDDSYLTTHNKARSRLAAFDMEEIVEELLISYFKDL